MKEQENERKELLTQYYNNAIKVIEGETAIIWKSRDRLRYINGYVNALKDNDIISYREARELYYELVEAIISMEEL